MLCVVPFPLFILHRDLHTFLGIFNAYHRSKFAWGLFYVRKRPFLFQASEAKGLIYNLHAARDESPT